MNEIVQTVRNSSNKANITTEQHQKEVDSQKEEIKMAFVYCWTDHKTDMLYVGRRKGHPDDGYVCSSDIMLLEYLHRPQDFTRQIIAEGDWNDMRVLESAILKAANASQNPSFYNRHIPGDKFRFSGTMSEEHKKKISKSNKGRTFSEEHKAKIAAAHKGRAMSEEQKALRRAYKPSEESNERRSAALTGRKKTAEHNAKVSAALKGKPKSEAHKHAIRVAKQSKLEKHNV